MMPLERLLIELLLNFVTREELNAFLRSPQHTATLVGCLIAVSGALLGAFLLLRGMSLTSDAISHTVLLGIVVAFLLMTEVFGAPGDTSSPWLILGASLAGMATVALTELLYRSGLVKQDAALGLTFPLLFAIAVILVSRYVEDVHLDEDAVLGRRDRSRLGQYQQPLLRRTAESLTVTPEHEAAKVRAPMQRTVASSASARGTNAPNFAETCSNCGEYTPAQAWSAGSAGTGTRPGVLSEVDFRHAWC